MSHLLDQLEPFSTAVAAVASAALALVVSSHAVLTRRDGRSAIGWVGLVWLVPILGSVLYVALGINRIRRRATALRGSGRRTGRSMAAPHRAGDLSVQDCEKPVKSSFSQNDDAHCEIQQRRPCGPLVRLGDRLTETPLTHGNSVQPLQDGDAAYPAMLAAIDAAEQTVALSSYIFDHDVVGLRFVRALAHAAERGVVVRVLVDAVGARYSWPRTSVIELLVARGVAARRFNPTRSPVRLRYLNLRSHRKILVVDGQVAFTGGMNIRADCVLAEPTAHPTRDLHFQLRGPVVAQLLESFSEDWWFTTQERLLGPGWWPTLAQPGQTAARAILDGPDEDFDKLRRIILGALTVAQVQVSIATPYFLPDSDIVAALEIAVLRGVQVNVLLPAESNLTLVQWAMTHHLWRILDSGCQVWLAPPPFDHSKLLIVDDH